MSGAIAGSSTPKVDVEPAVQARAEGQCLAGRGEEMRSVPHFPAGSGPMAFLISGSAPAVSGEHLGNQFLSSDAPLQLVPAQPKGHMC
jgi:hypothetical protein